VRREEELFKTVKDLAARGSDRVVVLVLLPSQMRSHAAKLSKLGVSCMEEIEAKDLLNVCRRIENMTGLT